MNQEKFSDSKPVKAFNAAALSAATDTVGLEIDTFGLNALTVVIGAVITTGNISAISWQESDVSGSGYTAVDDTEALYAKDLFPITGAGAKAIMAGTVAKKRFVKAVITTTGTVDIALQDCYGLLQAAYVKPNAVESSVLASSDIRSPGKTADAVSTPPKRV